MATWTVARVNARYAADTSESDKRMMRAVGVWDGIADLPRTITVVSGGFGQVWAVADLGHRGLHRIEIGALESDDYDQDSTQPVLIAGYVYRIDGGDWSNRGLDAERWGHTYARDAYYAAHLTRGE